MKKRLSVIFLLGLLLCNLFVIPAAAAADMRASEQIYRYNSNAAAIGNGEIAVNFSITAKSKMDEIGAETIRIYAQSGRQWILVKSYYSDDDGMSSADTNYFSNTIYYSGIAGTYYKIDVTVFAENSAGSDSRTDTRYVTAR